MDLKKEEKLELVKKEYPAGTRVVLKEMPDDPQAVPKGTIGTIKSVGLDPYGEVVLYVSWETGSSLNLLYEVDKFEKIQEGSCGCGVEGEIRQNAY